MTPFHGNQWLVRRLSSKERRRQRPTIPPFRFRAARDGSQISHTLVLKSSISSIFLSLLDYHIDIPDRSLFAYDDAIRSPPLFSFIRDIDIQIPDISTHTHPSYPHSAPFAFATSLGWPQRESRSLFKGKVCTEQPTSSAIHTQSKVLARSLTNRSIATRRNLKTRRTTTRRLTSTYSFATCRDRKLDRSSTQV